MKTYCRPGKSNHAIYQINMKNMDFSLEEKKKKKKRERERERDWKHKSSNEFHGTKFIKITTQG
jgi:hypothetical protein